MPHFIIPGDPPLQLMLMMLAYETIPLSRLNLYGSLVSRAGHSRFGIRVDDILQGVTGVMLIALGVRLAFEQKESSVMLPSRSLQQGAGRCHKQVRYLVSWTERW